MLGLHSQNQHSVGGSISTGADVKCKYIEKERFTPSEESLTVPLAGGVTVV